MLSLQEVNCKNLEIKSSRDNNLREMLYARCLSKGANRIGADLLLGLYSTDELFDSIAPHTKVKRDDDGTIVEVLD
jgi:hypothetical protein